AAYVSGALRQQNVNPPKSYGSVGISVPASFRGASLTGRRGCQSRAGNRDESGLHLNQLLMLIKVNFLYSVCPIFRINRRYANRYNFILLL
ncbi:MAG: hypothetical protein WBA93_17615, partial [Microcoleaceae cyanobacterium]